MLANKNNSIYFAWVRFFGLPLQSFSPRLSSYIYAKKIQTNWNVRLPSPSFRPIIMGWLCSSMGLCSLAPSSTYCICPILIILYFSIFSPTCPKNLAFKKKQKTPNRLFIPLQLYPSSFKWLLFAFGRKPRKFLGKFLFLCSLTFFTPSGRSSLLSR